jgi:hypothetical protein
MDAISRLTYPLLQNTLGFGQRPAKAGSSRLYSPKESFFDKTWRLTEIELVE